jgi:hypothetical protein
MNKLYSPTAKTLWTRAAALLLIAAGCGSAQSAAPAQVTVQLDPLQLHSGAVHLRGAVRTIGLLHADPDWIGTAVENAGAIDVRFVSAAGHAVRAVDVPILALNLDTGGDSDPTRITIRNTVPGGGMLPAGAVVTLQGAGFRSDTRVRLAGMPEPQVDYVNPSELQFTLPAAARLDGLQITAANPDGSAADYLSYWRGVPQGLSREPLINRAIPLFSERTTLDAVLPPQVLTRMNPDYALALALQNPGRVSADITIALASGENARIILPPGTRISREIGELFSRTAPAGGAVIVKSSEPVQVLGILADRRAGTVLPVALAVR